MEAVRSEQALAFPSNIKRYFNTKKFSDFTVRVDGEEFYVHKLVLSSQSLYFATMFERDEWKECDQNFVELVGDDPSAIESMLRFMYGYDEEWVKHGEEGYIYGMVDATTEVVVQHMQLSARAFAAAEKYGIPKLKQLAKARFATDVLVCRCYSSIPAVVREVYTPDHNIAQDLRGEVVKISREFVKDLVTSEDFMLVLGEHVEFAVEMVRVMAVGHPEDVEYECPKCEKVWRGSLYHQTGFHPCSYCDVLVMNWGDFIWKGEEGL
ncbi:hypothetical protein FQN54_000454 [Arachnomyces sp. PD_36]|nr:hypothetical protein FQN54_000454 [Arachnomyces sp. PD_36]